MEPGQSGAKMGLRLEALGFCGRLEKESAGVFGAKNSDMRQKFWHFCQLWIGNAQKVKIFHFFLFLPKLGQKSEIFAAKI